MSNVKNRITQNSQYKKEINLYNVHYITTWLHIGI